MTKRTIEWTLVVVLAAFAASACDATEKAQADKDEAADDKKDKKKKDKGDDTEDEDEEGGEESAKKADKKSKKKDKKDADEAGGEDETRGKDDAEPAAGGTTKKLGSTGGVTKPEDQTYPLSAITPVADNCSTPSVIMATAPESVGADYEWTWTRQAMLANGQYKVVRAEPAGPGQVAFDVHQAGAGFSNAFVLVARCHDGGTCNHLAAMYKAVVKSSKPQVICGKLPMELSEGTKKRSFVSMGERGEADLPAASDVVGLCARLGACMIASDPSITDDPGIACQKGPSGFKTACARNFPCAEVMACLDR